MDTDQLQADVQELQEIVDALVGTLVEAGIIELAKNEDEVVH